MREGKTMSATRPRASVSMLLAFLAVLWIAGGASRADVSGQVITRAAAAVILAGLALFGAGLHVRPIRVPLFLLVAAAALHMLHLIPLPPTIVNALPGRAQMMQEGFWVPISLSPGATLNSLFALVVPLAVLAAIAGSDARDRRLLVPGMILLVLAAALFGLFQFSIGYFAHPFVNNTPWQVSGPFANRNHYALMLALGCVLIPAWTYDRWTRPAWSGLLAVGMILFLFLMIMASGSRAGLVVGAIAVATGIFMVGAPLAQHSRHASRWMLPVFGGVLVVVVAGTLAISLDLGRAVSVTRFLAPAGLEDMRSRAMPTMLEMIRAYFPIGSGLGAFDPVFRSYEPFDLLKPSYFNHAHNDFLEAILDAGLAGLLFQVFSLGWWVRASVGAWRGKTGPERMLPRLGSAILGLILAASIFDYPARTPLIMAIVAIAAVWLADRPEAYKPSALPRPA